MIPGTAERGILIEAPVRTVWSAVTEPALLVEFTLTAEGTGARLGVTGSGLPRLARPEEDQAAGLDLHTTGWDTHPVRLRDHASGRHS